MRVGLELPKIVDGRHAAFLCRAVPARRPREECYPRPAGQAKRVMTPAVPMMELYSRSDGGQFERPRFQTRSESIRANAEIRAVAPRSQQRGLWPRCQGSQDPPP